MPAIGALKFPRSISASQQIIDRAIQRFGKAHEIEHIWHGSARFPIVYRGFELNLTRAFQYKNLQLLFSRILHSLSEKTGNSRLGFGKLFSFSKPNIYAKEHLKKFANLSKFLVEGSFLFLSDFQCMSSVKSMPVLSLICFGVSPVSFINSFNLAVNDETISISFLPKYMLHCSSHDLFKMSLVAYF